MFTTIIEVMTNSNDIEFDPIEDIQILACQQTWCMVRTYRLRDTLKFMQNAGRKIWELIPDDECISWVKIEYNILTYYKPQPWK